MIIFSNRIDAAFKRRKTLICYVPAGDPLFPDEYADIFVDCGVDILEIGLPNTNPYADGEVVAESMRRVKHAGVTIKDSARFTRRIVEQYPDIATVWMCYEDADFTQFDKHVDDARPDGLLMVGFDRRLDQEFLSARMRHNNVHHIGFVSFDVARDEVATAKAAGGFVFLQAVSGKTGVRSGDLDPSLAQKIEHLRANGVMAPIALGFGVSTGEQVRQATAFGADGVIIGSACIIAAQQGPDALRAYLIEMRAALDAPVDKGVAAVNSIQNISA